MGGVLPFLGKHPPFSPVIHRLSRGKKVYLLVDRRSGAEAVAKVYQGERAKETRDRELANMREVERLGFCEGKLRAACAYSLLDEPVAILMERAKGRDLDHYIKWAIKGGREEKLSQKLSFLASWFATLHTRGEGTLPAGGRRGQKYLLKVALKLKEAGLVSEDEASLFEERGEMAVDRISGGDRRVFVHGDATPTNLFFRGDQVTAIDFERAKVTHRCWDLGFVAGELIHHFMWRGGDGERGRSFAGHFLCRYSEEVSLPLHHLRDHLTLYLAMGLLRIARNPWLDPEHRRWLVNQAKKELGDAGGAWLMG